MLHTWTPESVAEMKTQGRTEPLVLECVRETDSGKVERQRFVAKYVNTQLTVEGLGRELFGSLLARHMGCPSPAPALIGVDAETAKALNIGLAARNIKLPVGPAFGSEYMNPTFPVADGSALNDQQFADAALLYAFDMLVQNPDRSEGNNPNCALHRARVHAYDFETCFSFLLAIGKSPWQFTGQDFCTKHVFYKAIRANRHKVDWEPARAAVSALTADLLDIMGAGVPEVWPLPLDKCKAHLLIAVEDAAEFVAELNRSVA